MIQLTPRAANQVRTMKAGADTSAERLRLFIETGGCSGLQYGMSFDDVKPDDVTFDS